MRQITVGSKYGFSSLSLGKAGHHINKSHCSQWWIWTGHNQNVRS